jgi:hypothetical protein
MDNLSNKLLAILAMVAFVAMGIVEKEPPPPWEVIIMFNLGVAIFCTLDQILKEVRRS